MSSIGRHDSEEPIQAIPKRVVGFFIRREVVIGVAAVSRDCVYLGN